MTPVFKLVFVSVVGLTLIAMGINVGLVVLGATSDSAMSLADTCSTTWKTGSGAIIGLLGGRAL